MPAFNSLGRQALAGFAVLCLACQASFSTAAGTAIVPDLLDLPAQHNARAQSALQLALAQAGERLVAVGESGAVMLSDDQGQSWRQAGSVPVSVLLTDVDFVSATQGWAVGHSGVILHSSDAGETWQQQLDGRQAAQIILDDARRRAAAGEEGAAAEVRSAEFLVADGPDKPFLSVRFRDELHGYAVGAYGLAVFTEDGGKTWQSLVGRIPNPRGKHLYKVLVTGDQLLIAGEQGALFSATDAGGEFREVHTPYPGTFFGVLRINDSTLLAYGLRGNALRSEDGGASWQTIELPRAVTLTAGVQLHDGSWLLANESGGLLRSTDEARSFVALAVPAEAGLSSVLQATDGALIISGSHGLSRIEPAAAALEK